MKSKCIFSCPFMLRFTGIKQGSWEIRVQSKNCFTLRKPLGDPKSNSHCTCHFFLWWLPKLVRMSDLHRKVSICRILNPLGVRLNRILLSVICKLLFLTYCLIIPTNITPIHPPLKKVGTIEFHWDCVHKSHLSGKPRWLQSILSKSLRSGLPTIPEVFYPVKYATTRRKVGCVHIASTSI